MTETEKTVRKFMSETMPFTYKANNDGRLMTNLANFYDWLKQNEALAISCVGSAFYCQRDIEGDSICNTQCEHCNEYYKPLEQ